MWDNISYQSVSEFLLDIVLQFPICFVTGIISVWEGEAGMILSYSRSDILSVDSQYCITTLIL